MERAHHADVPLACTLSGGDGPARMRRWEALSTKGRPVARRSGRTLEVRYTAGPGVHEELEALTALERECCPFVAWEVSREEQHPTLYVAADPATPDDVAPIAAMFGAH